MPTAIPPSPTCTGMECCLIRRCATIFKTGEQGKARVDRTTAAQPCMRWGLLVAPTSCSTHSKFPVCCWQGGCVVSTLLSIDERDLSSKSINDLVLALKGASGVSRLRMRPQQGGAGINWYLTVACSMSLEITPRCSRIRPARSEVQIFWPQ